MDARLSAVRRFSLIVAGCIPDMTLQRTCLALGLALVAGACDSSAQTPLDSRKAVLHLEFGGTNQSLRLQHGLKTTRFGAALEFTTALQTAEIDFTGLLHNA